MGMYHHPKMFNDGKGNLFLNFGGHGKEVELACFSADGTTLLTVKEVGIASIWDTASCTQVGEIRPTSPLVGADIASSYGASFKVFIESVALNNDGSLALLGLNDGTAGLFSTRDGVYLSSFYPPGTKPAEGWRPIRAVAFSPDGTLALVGFIRRAVGVWKINDYTLVQYLTSPYSDRVFKIPFFEDTVTTSLAFSKDNCYVFAGFADMAATIWNLENGEVFFEAFHFTEDILDVWVNGNKVRWATTGGSLWEDRGNKQAFELLSTGETWKEACFSPDGLGAVVRTLDGKIRRWSFDKQPQTLAKVNADLSENVNAIHLGKTSDLAVFVKGTEKVVITTSINRVEVDRGSKISGIALTSQEDKLATFGWTNSVELWRIPTGERLNVFKHNNWVSDVAFSADGHLMAVGTLGTGGPGEIRPIYVWDVIGGKQWCKLNGHTHQVHALAFDSQNHWLVSASLDRTVRLWQLDHENPYNSTEIWQVYYDDLEFHRIAVLSDGRIIVFRAKVLEVWQEQQKRLEISVPYHFRTHWHIVDDEASILGAFPQQNMRKWSLETGQETACYQNNFDRPESVPGADLITSHQDIFHPVAGCYLWRGMAGSFVHVGFGPRGWVTTLTLSHDATSIVVPGQANAALIDLEPTQRLRALMPFTGKLRASCILPNQVLMLNSTGDLYIHRDTV